MTGIRETALSDAVEEAIRRLACAEHLADASLVNLPLLYPSGATVVVQVSEPSGGQCTVTDLGFGFQEAELVGARRQFEDLAEDAARSSSISYAGRMFVIRDVPRTNLPAAMMAVATCSQRVVADASAGPMLHRSE